jgi:type VI protein secretion system component Hcp
MLFGKPSRFWLTIIAGTFAVTVASAEQLRRQGTATQVNPQPLPPAAAGRDAGTGAATGKRTHKPIIIKKETDAASPKLF